MLQRTHQHGPDKKIAIGMKLDRIIHSSDLLMDILDEI